MNAETNETTKPETEQEFGLSTEALRSLARARGLERRMGRPVEKLGRYTLLNTLIIDLAERMLAEPAVGGVA